MPIEKAPYRSPEVQHLERAVHATRRAILHKVKNQPEQGEADEKDTDQVDEESHE